MRNILFLQGPLGPFFKQFAQYASAQGHRTFKINFNGGDKHYAWADHAVSYVDKPDCWQAYLYEFIKQHRIHCVVVYGDCRFYHKVARQVAKILNIDFWVLEEGYLRSGFVTLEQGGCNANSSLFAQPEAFLKAPAQPMKVATPVGPTFLKRTWFATDYYIRRHLAQNKFKHYHHHRPWSAWQECGFWQKGFAQKALAACIDPPRYRAFIKAFDQQFFLLPLQVEVDFQLREHSRFESMTQMIEEVMISFAANAAPTQALLIKHHPQNRGFKHYGALITQLAAKLNIRDRVLYGHQFHLPDVYNHAKGVITINSTVGISALLHNLPTLVLGKAIYNIPGITSSASLDEFWHSSEEVDADNFARFRTYLCQHTQISGDFYKHSTPLIEQAFERILEVAHRVPLEVVRPHSIASLRHGLFNETEAPSRRVL